MNKKEQELTEEVKQIKEEYDALMLELGGRQIVINDKRHKNLVNVFESAAKLFENEEESEKLTLDMCQKVFQGIKQVMQLERMSLINDLLKKDKKNGMKS